jgi:hypothetical protein
MKRFSKFIQESVELKEQKMTFQDAEKLKSKHLAAMQHHKKSGNSKGYAAHSMVVDKFEDAYDRHGTGVIPVGRIMAASQKAFKDHPHSGMKESIELGEKLKASDDMGDWVKDFQDSDAPQFKGKSQKKRQQMAVAAKLDAEREAGMRKEAVELDEVSASTLRSYVDKARADKSRQQKARTVAKNDYKKYGIPSDKERADAAHSKASQRNTGISMAKRKLGGYTKGTQPKVLAREEVELNEVSDKKLDAYRQKAFADQPAGDDGSNKYRKRKFGRDLAFAKQTGRAKVLATKEEVSLDEVSTEKLRDYASAALQDKNKAKADKRWKYAGKAMQKVADREVKAAHARKYNKMEEVEQLDELSPKTLGSYVKKASADQYYRGKNVQYHDTKAQKADGPFSKETKRKHYAKASDAERIAAKRDTGISRAIRRLTREALDLSESHFKVGQRVECVKSGMTGTVVKSDKPEVGKYYTVKQDSGKLMKYAPNELKAM